MAYCLGGEVFIFAGKGFIGLLLLPGWVASMDKRDMVGLRDKHWATPWAVLEFHSIRLRINFFCIIYLFMKYFR